MLEYEIILIWGDEITSEVVPCYNLADMVTHRWTATEGRQTLRVFDQVGLGVGGFNGEVWSDYETGAGDYGRSKVQLTGVAHDSWSRQDKICPGGHSSIPALTCGC